MQSDRRSVHRIGIGQSAKLLDSDGQAAAVIVKDLSRDGFRLSHNGEDLVVGEIVSITSERGTHATGQIKWVTELEAGGVFLDLPADPNAPETKP